MLQCLACRCHSAQPLLRRVLRTSHQRDWATVPIIQGKSECLAFLSSLPQVPTTVALENYIKQNSSWAVIIGMDDTDIDWAEVGHGRDKARLDGQIIIERYGDVAK